MRLPDLISISQDFNHCIFCLFTGSDDLFDIFKHLWWRYSAHKEDMAVEPIGLLFLMKLWTIVYYDNVLIFLLIIG